MIGTFQALLVVMVAVLPGAAYNFAYERVFGSFGDTVADRLTRFLSASAVMHALVAGLTYTGYLKLIKSGDLARGAVHAWIVEGIAVAYVLIPIALGAFVGYGLTKRWPPFLFLFGKDHETRAFDWLWRQGKDGIVRISLTNDRWIAGIFATTDKSKSYAGNDPNSPDLWMSQQCIVDAETGEYETDGDGKPKTLDIGLLVRWENVRYLEFQEY